MCGVDLGASFSSSSPAPAPQQKQKRLRASSSPGSSAASRPHPTSGTPQGPSSRIGLEEEDWLARAVHAGAATLLALVVLVAAVPQMPAGAEALGPLTPSARAGKILEEKKKAKER